MDRPTEAVAADEPGLGPIRGHLERLLPDGGRGRRLVGWGVVAWTGIGLGIVVFLAWRGLTQVAGVIPYLVTAWLVVFALEPLVRLMVRRRIPRRLAATLAFLLAVVLVALLLSLLIPVLVHQAQTLVNDSPAFASKGGSVLDRLAHSTSPILRRAGDAIKGWLDDHAGTVQDSLRTITQTGLQLAHAGLVLLLGGFLGYLLLISLPEARRGLTAVVPKAGRERLRVTLAEAQRIVGGYVRARLIVSAVVGTLATLGLWLIGMPFWLVLGIVVGVANLVPMLGAWIGGVPVALVALLLKPPSFLLLVLVVITVAHAVDGYILSPLVLKETTRLHPVVVLLAVLLGAELAGFWGILAAIPAAGLAQFLLREWVVPRLRGGDPEPLPHAGPAGVGTA
jgi:predicted PurR-regulated permease PerM